MFRKSIISMAGILVLISALAVTAEEALKKAKAPQARRVRSGQQQIDKWLNELTRAYQDNDSEKVGQLIRQMRQHRRRTRGAQAGQRGGGKVAVDRKPRTKTGAGKGKAGAGGQRRRAGRAAGRQMSKGLSYKRIAEWLDNHPRAKSRLCGQYPKAKGQMHRGGRRGQGFGAFNGKPQGRRGGTREALSPGTQRGRRGGGEAMGRGPRRGMRGGRAGKINRGGRRGNRDRGSRGQGGRAFFGQARGCGQGKDFRALEQRPRLGRRRLRGQSQRRRGNFDNRDRGSERRQRHHRMNRFKEDSEDDFDWDFN